MRVGERDLPDRHQKECPKSLDRRKIQGKEKTCCLLVYSGFYVSRRTPSTRIGDTTISQSSSSAFCRDDSTLHNKRTTPPAALGSLRRRLPKTASLWPTMGGGSKRSRSKRKPARYQDDNDGDDAPAAAAAVSSDIKRSVDDEAPQPRPPQRKNDDGEGDEGRGRRSRSKPSRFQEVDQDDAKAAEETTTANAKKKPPQKKISKPAAAATKKANAAASGRTPKPVAAQNPKPTDDTNPKKPSTRIKIKLSVGKNKGKKRKADSDDVDDEHATMEVKVRVRAAKKLLAGHGVAKVTPTTLGKIATSPMVRTETNESSGTDVEPAVAKKNGGGKKLKIRAGANKTSKITSGNDNVKDKQSKVSAKKEMKVKICVAQKPIHKKPATASFEQQNGEGNGDDSRSKSFTSSNGNEVRVRVICGNVFPLLHNQPMHNHLFFDSRGACASSKAAIVTRKHDARGTA